MCTPGLTTSTSRNGEAALQKFHTERYDLVLMDLQMPVLDGYDAVRAMRGFERERHRSPTAIVALTAHAMDEKVRRCRAEGCDAFATKPVTRAQLLEVMGAQFSR